MKEAVHPKTEDPNANLIEGNNQKEEEKESLVRYYEWQDEMTSKAMEIID
jgi:hypothetical protein